MHLGEEEEKVKSGSGIEPGVGAPFDGGEREDISGVL